MSERLHLPILVKEARALVNVLKAGRSFVCNTRVDVHIDSLAVLQSWQRQGGKSKLLNDTCKELHETAPASNSHLFFQFVPSRSNPADAPSRQLSNKDCMLSEESWRRVERHFGPHSIDFMSFGTLLSILLCFSLLSLLWLICLPSPSLALRMLTSSLRLPSLVRC